MGWASTRKVTLTVVACALTMTACGGGNKHAPSASSADGRAEFADGRPEQPAHKHLRLKRAVKRARPHAVRCAHHRHENADADPEQRRRAGHDRSAHRGRARRNSHRRDSQRRGGRPSSVRGTASAAGLRGQVLQRLLRRLLDADCQRAMDERSRRLNDAWDR